MFGLDHNSRYLWTLPMFHCSGWTYTWAVTAVGGIHVLAGRITTPDVLTAHFDFDGTPVTWNHRIWGPAELHPETTYGSTFYGEKATLFVTDCMVWRSVPFRYGCQSGWS